MNYGSKIRINPKALPTGEFKVIPSLEYIRLSHKELKAYNAELSLAQKDGFTTYTSTLPQITAQS